MSKGHDVSFGDGSASYGLIPEPFTEKWLLYTQHFFFSFVSRMWDMGIVLLIAELTDNSLFFVALAGLLGSLGIFALMANIGAWLDTTDRLESVKTALIVKITAVSMAYLLCAMFGKEDTKVVAYTLPFLCAITAVAFKTITQSVEKDWLVVLSDGDGVWLSSTNSVMTQIDLTCNTAAPAVTGIIFATFHKSVTAMVLLACNAIATVFLWYFVHYLYRSWPSLGSRHAAYDPKLRRRTDMPTIDTASSSTSQSNSQGAGGHGGRSYNPLGEGAAAVGNSGLKMSHADTGGGSSSPNTPVPGVLATNSSTSPEFFTPAGRPPQAQTDSDAYGLTAGKSKSDAVAALAKTLGDFYDDNDDDDDNDEGKLAAREEHQAISMAAPSPANRTTTTPGQGLKTTSALSDKDTNSNSNGGIGGPAMQTIPLHPYVARIPGARAAVDFYRRLQNGYATFKASGCAGVMLAYSFLFFTVLSFGPLMTVYLRWAKVSDYWIGLSRGANALFGFAGASLFPYLKSKWGIWLLAQRSLWYQFAMVFFAASAFFWGTQDQINVIIIFGVLFSRVGLWIFDLCARQIAQETIPENLRGAVNGFWASIVAFFNMATFIVAITFPDPNDFILLTSISACVIFAAATTYTISQPKFFETDFREDGKDACVDSPAVLLRSVCMQYSSWSGSSSSDPGRSVEFAPLPQDSQHGSV